MLILIKNEKINLPKKRNNPPATHIKGHQEISKYDRGVGLRLFFEGKLPEDTVSQLEGDRGGRGKYVDENLM